jgi:hypothetical protein
MSDLFRYLVERSAGGQSNAAKRTVAGSGGALESTQSGAEHTPGMPRDAIQPRQRSRYERRPDPEPVRSDVAAHEDEPRQSSQPPTDRSSLDSDRIEPPAARAPSVRPANEPLATSYRTAEHVQRREAPPDTPAAAEPSITDDHAEAGPRAVAEPRAVSAADRPVHDQPPPVRNSASPQPQKDFQADEARDAAAEPAPRPQSSSLRGSPVSPRPGNVTASIGPPRTIEQPVPEEGRKSRAAAGPRAVSAADRQDHDQPPPVRNGASPQPQKIFQADEARDAAAEPAPRPQSSSLRGSPASPPPGNVTASIGPPRTKEQPVPQAGEIAPVSTQAATRQRETPGSPSPLPARPAIGQASAPRVHITIGRVEVQAVYASPPSPARQPSPTPSMSLNDYLKQRDGS